MTSELTDTIVAPITGVHGGAVIFVRLSGPDSWEVAQKVFRDWPAKVVPRHATYGEYRHGDDGIVIPFEAKHSYTGQDSVEMSIHGSAASLQLLMDACYAGGARPANPGEFTLRAFMSGRIDLSQAEAVREVVESQTERQLKLAKHLLGGELKTVVRQISDQLSSILVELEAQVDFSQEIGELDRAECANRLAAIGNSIEDVTRFAGRQEIVRRGIRIAIVGEPNVGKSSLLNAILRTDRAIVSPTPGTTRDFVEGSIEWQGFPLVFVDTAGIREACEQIEEEGIRRTLDQAQRADIILFVYDGPAGWSSEQLALLEELDTRRTFPVANKADLGEPIGPGIPVSAKTGAGIDAMLGAALMQFGDLGPFPVQARHHVALNLAVASLRSATSLLDGDAPLDLVSVLLRQSLMDLGTVTGETVEADVLEQIFKDFCIGK